MHLPLWISCPAALTVSMLVCSSCISVPVLFLNTWACTAQGRSSGQDWRGLWSYGLCEVGSACWLLEWKIPLSLPSCHQLALLSEGRLHCFLFHSEFRPLAHTFRLSLCRRFVPHGLCISAVDSARSLGESSWRLLFASYVRGQRRLAKHSCASMSVNVCLWKRVRAHVSIGCAQAPQLEE